MDFIEVKWQAIIFDRDGTLVDSLPMIVSAFRHGIEPYADRMPGESEWFQAFGPPEREVLGHFVPADRKEDAYRRFLRYYKAHYDEVPVFPGMKEVLEGIRESRTKLALFTGAGRETAVWSLSRKGILHLFDLLVTGDDVRNGKPDPEGPVLACARLSAEPAATLLVGDAESDMQAGKGAGTKTALARWAGLPQAGTSDGADFVFDTVGQFRDFLFDGR
jgi:pyrophosphatase PpaX